MLSAIYTAFLRSRKLEAKSSCASLEHARKVGRSLYPFTAASLDNHIPQASLNTTKYVHRGGS